ncbi:MAG: hypothetical protein FWE38_05155 [Firmicutes bacterium]|nr:hypothetical protein [Bacillota bacterium]
MSFFKKLFGGKKKDCTPCDSKCEETTTEETVVTEEVAPETEKKEEPAAE